ncbi:flagellar motor switch protein FliN [Phycicoccus sp. M110.8]|uniref:flagellar motor switch protein FliN n=1 Tax=Phycicoccus sp. M110.8 TaxID=3075433 RepID=UPI0028FD508B|nr:flagellar motor switch protein FliN [Phycicoccus sp. M110.8]MDU0313413.1 flagellar motor switch protein FliN [Phycicoccus sp. M110.8]
MTLTEPQVDAALLTAAALVAERLGGPAGATASALGPAEWPVLQAADLAPALVTTVEGAWEGQVAVLAPRDRAADRQTALTAGISSMALELGPLVPSATHEVEVGEVVPAGAGVRVAAVLDGDVLVAALVLTPRAVQAAALPPLGASTPVTDIDPRRLHLLRDVEMGISVELGRTRMTVQDVLGLAPGAVIELDRPAGAPVDVLVNGTLMARGEVVVVDEEFAVRVTEVVGPEADARLRA